MKQAQKILLNPFMTTTWPLSSRADIKTTLDKLERKLFVYGVLSPLEQTYWDEHNKFMFGKIRQKDTI